MDKKEIKSAIATLSDNNINPYDLLLAINETDLVPATIVESRKARVLARDGKVSSKGYLKNAREDLINIEFNGKDQVLKVLDINIGATTLQGLNGFGHQEHEFSFKLLHLGFTVMPILAGADKFFNFTTNWGEMLAPAVVSLSPLSKQKIMMLVGGLEMIAGIATALNPKLGGKVIAGWLGVVILNVLISGKNYDLVLRDALLAISAYVMSDLAPDQLVSPNLAP